MKKPKSYLSDYSLEKRDDRTDRVSRELVEAEATARREKMRQLRLARLGQSSPSGRAEEKAKQNDALE